MSLNRNQALDYFRSGDLISLGMDADALRRKLHPESVVTYTLERKIPWTQAADDQDLSSPYTPSKSSAPHLEETLALIAQAVEMDCSAVVLQGGRALNLHTCGQILSAIHRRFPDISLSGFSAHQIWETAQRSGLTIRDTLASLLDAGLDSVHGDGDEILLSEESQGAVKQWSFGDWLNVHRIAHRLGMHTTAEFEFGGDIDPFLDGLDQIRTLQEETGGFTAFHLSNDQRQNGRDPITAVEYLKGLAIARLYLGPIRNIQCSLAAQGLKVLQLSFRFGANDAGSVAFKKSNGAATEEQLRHTIRGAGFKPVQRNALYTTCFLN